MTANLAATELESLEYQNASDTFRARYDRNATSASMAVVAALTDILDVDPTELDPLHYAVDTDALDELGSVGRADGSIEISFTVDDYVVTVSSGELVTVSPPERTDDRNAGATWE